MIIELFTNELVEGHAILWPSLFLFVVGIFMSLLSDNLALRVLGILMAVPGLFGIVACINSGANTMEPEDSPVTKIEAYPVELRPENNTLYVFIQGNYSKVSTYTKEYVEPTDTMFRYYYKPIGGQLIWEEGFYTTFSRKSNVTFLDSISIPTELKGDTVKLDMTPSGDFIAKPDSL